MRAFCSALPIALALAGCSSNEESRSADAGCPESGCPDAAAPIDWEERSLCAAIRGNGDRVFAHFASLARIVEHYGPIDAAAGGSSASISIFLTESIQGHPQTHACEGDPCAPRERADRIALLFKSMAGYTEILADTPEGLALRLLAPLAAQIREAGLAELIETDLSAARDALLDLLDSEDLRTLINPELIDLIVESDDPLFHLRDLVGELENLGSFHTDDPSIFARPGPIDFEAFAELVGRVGSFYAGEGPLDDAAMERFFADCAGPSRGLLWDEAAALPSGDTTCGERFRVILEDWREAFVEAGGEGARIDDPVGGELSALISTSVLTGSSADAFDDARAQYLAAQEDIELGDIDFDDVRFGYWGQSEDLSRVHGDREGFGDDKTERFLPLGAASWREALRYSPAEPGLARALELDQAWVSAGGWSDLHPTLVLQNLGCDEVIYVTRRGAESNFAQGVAELLGMDEATREDLYALDAESSFARSVEEADATWCTDWDNQSAFDIAAMSEHAYNAPLESVSEYFRGVDEPYDELVDSTGHPGCTPGAAP